MGNRYYYNPDSTTAYPIGEIWGIPSDIFVVGIITLMLGALIIYGTWDWWVLKYNMKKAEWKRRRRLKSGKGQVKSFIIEVAGKELTQNKFICITNDINSILAGNLLKTVHGANPGRKLDVNNVLGITDVPNADNHLFVVWYREV